MYKPMGILFNILDPDETLIQIFGDVTGIAQRHHKNYQDYYVVRIAFFIDSKLYNIETNPDDMTMRRLSQVKDRVNRIYQKALKEAAHQ